MNTNYFTRRLTPQDFQIGDLVVVGHSFCPGIIMHKYIDVYVVYFPVAESPHYIHRIHLKAYKASEH